MNNLYQECSIISVSFSGRIKRAEDVLQEDRSAVQSLIMNTRNLEQTVLNTQKDLFARRDLQAARLDELRLQIDDMQRSKENLERSAFSLIDEIKSLKSKVDVEAMNLNSIGSDLRNKTRRLEDENRQNVSFLKFLKPPVLKFIKKKLNSNLNN